jgi:hypothetical protein
MYMLIMVLDDPSRLNEVLAGWEGAGVRGVTILESTGLHRVLMRHRPQAAYAGFSQIFGAGRVGHNTLFAVVDGMATVESAAAATEQIVGKLDDPNTGILFALPVARVWGLPSAANAAPMQEG